MGAHTLGVAMADDAENMMRLIFALRRAGVTEPDVLHAIEATPREMFVERAFLGRAFEDTALPIPCGQTISQPTVVAIMTRALELDPRTKVLEIGTGSGYHAAVMARLARRVYTVERHKALAIRARERMTALGLANVVVRAGDGTQGWPEQAPFDRIIVTAAAEDAPRVLIDQLRVGGTMVLPVGGSDAVQKLIKIVKTDEGLVYTDLGEVLFVPLVEGMAQDPDY